MNRDLGQSVQGRALKAQAFECAQKRSSWILFLGAVHGDEIEGVWLLEEIQKLWSANYPAKKINALVWTEVNPDGVLLKQRWNANNIDLNRNLPSKDWTPEIKNPRYPPGPSAGSEPENKALIKLIDDLKPTAILSVHSFSKFQVNSNGPARPWAEKIAAVCNYPVTEDIGYPTPGCLGTYAGAEKQIPTITLEIERGIAREKVLALHVPVILTALKYWDEK